MKGSLKNIIPHAILCVAVTCMFFKSLFCMDIISTDKVLALSVMLRHDIAHFNYRDLSCLAVNKETERMLYNFSKDIKKRVMHLINQQYPYWFSGKKIIWYKYGTVCATIDSRDLVTAYSLWEDQNIIRNFFDEYVKEKKPRLIPMGMNFDGQGKLYMFAVVKYEPKKKARIKHASEKLKIKK